MLSFTIRHQYPFGEEPWEELHQEVARGATGSPSLCTYCQDWASACQRDRRRALAEGIPRRPRVQRVLRGLKSERWPNHLCVVLLNDGQHLTHVQE